MTIMNTNVSGGEEDKPFHVLQYGFPESYISSNRYACLFAKITLLFTGSIHGYEVGHPYDLKFSVPTTVRQGIKYYMLPQSSATLPSSEPVILDMGEYKLVYSYSRTYFNQRPYFYEPIYYYEQSTDAGHKCYTASQISGVSGLNLNVDGNVKLKGVLERVYPQSPGVVEIIVDKNGNLISHNIPSNLHLPQYADEFYVTDIELL